MNFLYQHSVQTILINQAETGAIIASPNFSTYQYAWFRDGSYCAHALLSAGHIQEAEKFHRWASQVVLRFRSKMEQCIQAAQKGEPPIAELCFHSRFTVEGDEVPGNWGHHQLDGLGAWLWALGEYQQQCPDQLLTTDSLEAATLVKDYLTAMWAHPCSDCWEENETMQHTYTLGAIYAGLKSYASMADCLKARQTAESIQTYIFEKCVENGTFIKSIGLPDVDANIIALYYPFNVVEWSDPRMQNTIARMELDLATPVGLHRYRNDTYYGSGEWVLLTAWLGWAYAQAGEREKAIRIRTWVEAHASQNGNLPEQVAHAIFNQQEYYDWLDRWGPIASPLVWSHAKYILLVKSLQADSK